MLGKRNRELEINQVVTTMLAFQESYNKSIPASFPQASAKTLRQFQVLHPSLFKSVDEWSIDKHRKKFMDWLPSYSEVA